MSSDMVSRFEENGESPKAAAEQQWAPFAMLCEALAGTRSKLAKRAAMAEYLRTLDAATAGIAAQFLTGTVFAESDDRKVQVGSQFLVRAIGTVTHACPERFHTAYRKYGDLGATAEELLTAVHAEGEPVSLIEMKGRMESLAVARTQAAKSAQLVEVLRRLRPVEAKYFIKLLLGDMRMGVKQSLVEEAIAVAAQEELPAVRRAEMLLGNLPAVVELAWRHTLDTARFQMFHPLGFMLATPAASAEEALARFVSTEDSVAAQLEDKYDGMRAQVHCGDDGQPGRVRIFSRTREDVTASFPELEEWFSQVASPAILDGEILAWDFDLDRALPFTSLQQRLGRKRVTAEMRAQTRVVYMAFDMLLHGDELLLEAPLQQRRNALEMWAGSALQNAKEISVEMKAGMQTPLFATETVAETSRVLNRLKLAPITTANSAAEIDEAFTAAQMRGNEGLMLKALSSIYQPGRRGSAWLKLKRELATLDVVVTAVEYGHGRRAGVLSDYTFAVQEEGTLRNVGKAYSGLTDVEIATLTEWFLEHTLDTRGGQVLVEPKIVLEVAFNNVMESDRHDSGYSLRFPRILRIRTDKPVEEIDTVERVVEIFAMQHQGRSGLQQGRAAKLEMRSRLPIRG